MSLSLAWHLQNTHRKYIYTKLGDKFPGGFWLAVGMTFDRLTHTISIMESSSLIWKLMLKCRARVVRRLVDVLSTKICSPLFFAEQVRSGWEPLISFQSVYFLYFYNNFWQCMTETRFFFSGRNGISRNRKDR